MIKNLDEDFPLKDMALGLVRDARKSDRRAVQRVLEEAVIALRGVVKYNLLPDEERRIYLEFLLESLETVTSEHNPLSPNKAFYWSVQSRPQKRRARSDWEIFLLIGMEYDSQLKSDSTTPLKLALNKVGTKLGCSGETLRKEIWQPYGAAKGWGRLRSVMKR